MSSRKEEILVTFRKKFGFIPNGYKEMARSLPILELFSAAETPLADGSFLQGEQAAIALSVAASNEDSYGMSLHAKHALELGVAKQDVEAIRELKEPGNLRLADLTNATWMLMAKKGRVSTEQLQWLEEVGLTRDMVYELVAIIARETASNYVNGIARTRVDTELSG